MIFYKFKALQPEQFDKSIETKNNLTVISGEWIVVWFHRQTTSECRFAWQTVGDNLANKTT